MVAMMTAAFTAAIATAPKPAGGLGGRTAISIKLPEPYKPSMDVDAWLSRAQSYAATAGITDVKDRILQLTISLSIEAHAIMRKAGFDLESSETIEEVEESLRLIFGDQKTEAQWGDEYQSAKQDATETAGYFVDRVKWLASKAFVDVWTDGSDVAKLQLVRTQVIKGLRSANVKMWIVHNPADSLETLRAKVVQYEKDEAAVTGKPAVAKPASHLNAGKPSSSNTKPSSDRDQPDEKKKRGRGKGGDKKDQAKGSGSNDKPWSKTKCQLCQKIGHDAAHCFSRKSKQSEESSAEECTRCGRTGHETSACFRDRHKNGSELKPNGVPVPKWYHAKYLYEDREEKKKEEPKAAVHLNAAGGASALTRPRTSTMQW
jgi:hypothetical protein